MTNLHPLRREDHPELEDVFRLYDETLSFVPNSPYTAAFAARTIGPHCWEAGKHGGDAP